MNFIKHFLGVVEKISMDDRLNTTHVSLYVSLFVFWNQNHFETPFSINRQEVMKVSKIGSLNTYHKCLKDLDQYGFLDYIPSHNPFIGSQINMFRFDTSAVQALGNSRRNSDTSSVKALRRYINNNKLIKHKQGHAQNLNKYDEPL